VDKAEDRALVGSGDGIRLWTNC